MDPKALDLFIRTARVKGVAEDDITQYVIKKIAGNVANTGAQGLAGQGATAVDPSITGSIRGILDKSAPITQIFGNYNPEVEKYSGGINNGVDFGVDEGTEVGLPEGKWQVEEIENTGKFNRGYGNSILVKNVDTGEKIRLSHLSALAAIKAGDVIAGNNKIGRSGKTGNVTGPHLDVEYYDQAGKMADILKTRYGGSL